MLKIKVCYARDKGQGANCCYIDNVKLLQDLIKNDRKNWQTKEIDIRQPNVNVQLMATKEHNKICFAGGRSEILRAQLSSQRARASNPPNTQI